MRKIFFAWVAFIIVMSLSAQEKLLLENEVLKAEFDAKNGSLVHFVNKQTGWEIVNRASLGQSFELLMPLTDKDLRFNVVKGINQRNPVIEQLPDKITFTWAGMRSELMNAEENVIFKGEVALTPTGLEFGGEITNHGKYPVEYVSWPFLGEVTVPDKGQPLYHSTRSDTRELFPHFFNEHGYWGVDYPTSTYPLPDRSYVLVNNREQGFIVYGKESFPNNLLITSFELIPGFEISNTNPADDMMDGQPVRIQLKANQIIYNKPGEKTKLNPVKISLYKGSWNTGVDCYIKEKNNATPQMPGWIKDPLTWQKVSVENGDELVNYAREGLKCGVDVLQVRGWYQEVNRKIAEAPGLKDAIEKCQELGVKIVLETNWYTVDAKSQTDANEIKRMAVKDPFGFPYDCSSLCSLSEYIEKRVIESWSKLPSLLAADGYINSDNNHRNKSYLCFSNQHGHKPGEPTANGTMVLDRKMAEILKSYGEKAAMGFGFLDQQSVYYDGYQISGSVSDFVRHRYMNPSTTITLPVDVKNARDDINQAIKNRFNINYDLQFFSTHLSDYPHVVLYGQKVEDFRKRYQESVWNAEFMDTKGAVVEGRYLSYSVFKNKLNGKNTIVVVNTSNDQVTTVKARFENASAMQIASPEKPEMEPYQDGFDLLPLSVAAIFEQ